MKQKTCILHITPLIGRASFGIGPIVLNLAAAQQNLGHSVHIWCYDTLEEARFLETHYGLHNGTIRLFQVWGPKRLGYSPTLEKAIIKEGLSFNIVHQHGIWTGISRALNRWRSYTKGPTIIAPQGSLEPYVLRKSSWKKRLAITFYEHQNLHKVGCMQALSFQEATNFREFGLCSPISIIPNGISKLWISQYCDSRRFRTAHNIPQDIRILLFLGRITPKKGLPMLLQAMNSERELLKGWVLIIAGVNEFNHQQEVQRLVNELTLQPYIKFIGPQFDQDKRDAFAAADVFVLPSYSEGAPIAILEALGAGVPVLTTKASPWEELFMYNCGWWTDISLEAITDALQDVLQRPKATLQEMGQRAKQLAIEKYTWPHIADQTLMLYDWLLHESKKPDFVILE